MGWVTRFWKPILIGVAAFLLGVGAGASGSGTEEDEGPNPLAAEVDRLEAELEEERLRAEGAEQQFAEIQDETREKEAELEALQEEVAARERKIRKAEQRVVANTITDGIWQLGEDYTAGLYRAPGGSSCYWALLGSADTQDIINNGGFGPNQTITIDSPWFESTDCGEWKKLE